MHARSHSRRAHPIEAGARALLALALLVGVAWAVVDGHAPQGQPLVGVPGSR